MLRGLLLGLAVATAAVGAASVAVGLRFQHDMAGAHARIGLGSLHVDTPWGRLQFSRHGQGPAVLVVHGSGGGFDQGEFLARAALGGGFDVVTPSRFGYLGSTFQPGATFDEQAHAYAHLLDHLGLPRVAVVAFSHGGPSALLFAALYPERVSSLVLLSAGVATSAEAGQAQADRQGAALMRLFRYDFPYWAFTQALPDRFLGLMGVGASVRERLTPAQRQLARELVDGMNPVSPRRAGAAFDHHAALPGARIAAIRAPTLILHARDDTLQRFHNAEFAARTIPGARLQAFDQGGHLLLAVEQDAVRAAIARHFAGTR
jgi:pimeloyl-ACP methyl ester carboxylesterase